MGAKVEFPIGKTLFHLVANTGTSPCPTVDLDLVQTTRKVNGTRHSLRKFQPGKRAHLFRFSTFLGIFQWDEPTKRVPFTTEPEIPEILTKWKAPKASLFVKYLTPTYSYKINEVFANVLWKRFLCEREPHHAITWDFVLRFLIVTILGIRFWAPEQYSWRFIQIHVLLSLTWIGVSSLKPPNVIQVEIFFFFWPCLKSLFELSSLRKQSWTFPAE